ncbi:nitroreductase family protein [Acaryochloris sp. CCMEE 5410]|uniref:nitroreductase family protein n=1 Tax=Acaryochloris sp. CCMEE 5410 TaxID=310037 RepID=UPI000248462A|nr:nitroreductase family protein [Acaryochloris sp. CCMEE 5410]KAI9129677.1 nitroreductase family protein [Acaryochloris sp. CCMEE 5410]
MATIQIDAERCQKCGKCVQICPTIFAQHTKGAIPHLLDTTRCIECGHCVAICPSEAISHSSFPSGTIAPIQPEQLPDTAQFMELLRSRRSVREFSKRQVDRALIEQIIEAACFAPSSHNVQSTEYIVVQDPAMRQQIVELTIAQYRQWRKLLGNPIARTLTRLVRGSTGQATLDELREAFTNLINQYGQGSDPILREAPTLLIFHGDRHIGFAGVNANLALQNASLVCETLKLGAFYTGYVVAGSNFNPRLARLLKLPPNHKIYAGLAIGHPRFHYKNWIERKPAQIQWF